VKQWHIYYRTQGMAHRNERGFARSDVLADTAEEAFESLAGTKRIIFARVYPGAACLAIKVEWLPKVIVRHQPHEEEE
jgi:hypothetical protein